VGVLIVLVSNELPKVFLFVCLIVSVFSQLLERVFNIMREKNPTMVGGQKKKLVMKPPQVVRVGAKKTSFVNFTDICKM
jgi:translation initiation factor 2 beta subunit (eIF-2beta)/eIF-5